MGATRVIVGSHLWEDDRAEADAALTTGAVMSKGSVLVYTGSIYHGGAPTSPTSTGSGSTWGTRWGGCARGKPVPGVPPEIARTPP